MNKERLEETIYSLSQDKEKRKELIEISREHMALFPQEDAASKILYIVSMEMKGRYSRKGLRYFEAVKERLLEIRRTRYGYG